MNHVEQGQAIKRAVLNAASSLLYSLKSYLSSRPPTLSRKAFQKSLFILLFIRISILTCIVGSTFWNLINSLLKNADASPGNFSVGLVLSFYGLSILNLVAVKRGDRLPLVGIIQICTDILLSSFAIVFTGSMVSIVLYLLVIVSAALILGAHGALLTAAASALCYLIISSGILLTPPAAMVYQTSYELLLVYFSLVVVGLFSGYLSRQLELAGLSIEKSKRDLSLLAEQQNRLINDLSEGIITLDKDLLIVRTNDAVCEILGLRSQQVSQMVGKPLDALLRSIGQTTGTQVVESNLRKETSGDITISLKQTSAQKVKNDQALGDSKTEPGRKEETAEIERIINYRVRSVTDGSNQTIGYLFLLSDVTHLRRIEHRLSLHERMTRLLAIDLDQSEASSGSCPQVQIIGESPIMRRLFSLIGKLSDSTASVLIWGESGTGKELIARAIHCRGPRSNKAYVAVNCGAIPENLIESELFGHKKGAFTGAISDNSGLFRKAHGGTIFLDEIGELPLPLQTKLLRVLQERTVRAVGDSRDVPIDVRVIAATNKDLRREVQKGTFREDLYYRVNVVNLFVPPLRERREDLQLLLGYFIQKYSRDLPVIPRVSPEALDVLMSYPFPGNVRELENLIERAIVLGGTAILPEHLSDELTNWQSQLPALRTERQVSTPELQELGPETSIKILPVDLEVELARIEQIYLALALESTHGIKKQAAELLGLNFRSFRYRLKKYGLAIGSMDDLEQLGEQ